MPSQQESCRIFIDCPQPLAVTKSNSIKNLQERISATVQKHFHKIHKAASIRCSWQSSVQREVEALAEHQSVSVFQAYEEFAADYDYYVAVLFPNALEIPTCPNSYARLGCGLLPKVERFMADNKKGDIFTINPESLQVLPIFCEDDDFFYEGNYSKICKLQSTTTLLNKEQTQQANKMFVDWLQSL